MALPRPSPIRGTKSRLGTGDTDPTEEPQQVRNVVKTCSALSLGNATFKIPPLHASVAEKLYGRCWKGDKDWIFRRPPTCVLGSHCLFNAISWQKRERSMELVAFHAINGFTIPAPLVKKGALSLLNARCTHLSPTRYSPFWFVLEAYQVVRPPQIS